MYCLGNLLPLVSLGPPSLHLTRHPRFPSLSSPPGLGGALLSAPDLPKCWARAQIFPGTRAPPAKQVSARCPKALPSIFLSLCRTLPAAHPEPSYDSASRGGIWDDGGLVQVPAPRPAAVWDPCSGWGLGGGVVHEEIHWLSSQ